MEGQLLPDRYRKSPHALAHHPACQSQWVRGNHANSVLIDSLMKPTIQHLTTPSPLTQALIIAIHTASRKGVYELASRQENRQF